MKKIFTLFAVAAMAFAAQADVLTVADGTATSEYAPIYGFYMDTKGAQSQAIYPADMLSSMKDCKITAVKFFATAPFALGEGELQFALMEVDQAGYTTTELITGATVVASGYPVIGASELVFTFDAPYEYKGGNLLIETTLTQAGGFKKTEFYGVGTETTTAIASYSYSWGGPFYEVANFLPKAEFTFEGQAGNKTDAPGSQKDNFVYNDDNLYYNAYTITLTETEPSTIYYRIGVMTEGQFVYGEWMEYTAPITVTDEGTYMIEAYAVADGKAESDHIWDGFTVSKLVGVDELMAGKAVAGVRYFNLAGQEMAQPSGLTIQVTTYTDGTTSAVKVVK